MKGADIFRHMYLYIFTPTKQTTNLPHVAKTTTNKFHNKLM